VTLSDELEAAMIAMYRRAGEETGYWGRRYLQSVKKNGGLVTAKRMLQPRTLNQRAGLDALIEAGKPELTLEALVQLPRFAPLFTTAELLEARARVGDFATSVAALATSRDHLYPDDLPSGHKYVECARKQVRVNAFERNPKARAECIEHHGSRCTVCELSFEERYGARGKGFIHVHHTKPLALLAAAYVLDPIKDLVPVCPNCHAMLHRGKDLLTIDQLRATLRAPAG
jgi:5-methylcytosine-specific restriction enzyme A